MAGPTARMRLTVDVLPLAEEDSHGPYRHDALAAFKGRRFALPVHLDDTIEQVWAQIEERYKRNYLTPAQASSFTIKVLQDAYDCDLDLGDTVSSIFESEPDPAKRLIKVIPSFVNRDFSVPFTSNLRPASAQKRRLEVSDEGSEKRRRIERGGRLEQEAFDRARNQPLPSTESANSGYVSGHTSERDAVSRRKQKAGHTGRSKSSSLVQLRNEQTGREEFGPVVKEESPELGMPTVRAPYEHSTTPEAIRPRGKRLTTYRRPSGRPSKIAPNETETLAMLNGSPTPPPCVETPSAHPFKSSTHPFKSSKLKESSQTSSWMPKSVSKRGKATIQKTPRSVPDKSRTIRSSSPMVVIQTKSRSISRRRETYELDMEGVEDTAEGNEAVITSKSRSPSPLTSKPPSESEIGLEAQVETQPEATLENEPEKAPEKALEKEPVDELDDGLNDGPNDEPDAEPYDEPGAQPDAEPATEPADEPATEPADEPADEPEAEPDAEPETMSRSISIASSTRSSPAVSRRPARFLSHSPTLEKSSSEDEGEEEEEEDGDVQPSAHSPAKETSEEDSSSEDEDSEVGEEEEDTQVPAPAIPLAKESAPKESDDVDEDSTSGDSSDDNSEKDPDQHLQNSANVPEESQDRLNLEIKALNRKLGFAIVPSLSAKTPAQATVEEQNDSDSNEEERDDEDVEMTDAAVEGGGKPASLSSPSLPSPPAAMLQRNKGVMASPPASSQTPQFSASQPLPRKTPIPPPGIPQQKNRAIASPPASQPLPRKTPVPLPGTRPGPATFSSQPSTVNGTPRLSQSRPSYKGFPSIKDQLSAVRSSTATAQTRKTFDPASQSLSALAKAKNGKKSLLLEDSDSDDESDSDSSSSESEGPVNAKKAWCSVA